MELVLARRKHLMIGLHRMDEAGLSLHIIDATEELAAMQGQSPQSENY